jgi:hypothetical protein
LAYASTSMLDGKNRYPMCSSTAEALVLRKPLPAIFNVDQLQIESLHGKRIIAEGRLKLRKSYLSRLHPYSDFFYHLCPVKMVSR